MRTLLVLGGLLVACSNDSFGGGDASTNDGAANDVVIGGDSSPIVEAGPDALDTSTFESNVVLWFDAADAVVNNGSVSQWPDHKNKALNTTILGGANTNATCTIGGVVRTDNALNGKPSVSFCAGMLSVADDVTLELGTSPFTIEAVARVQTQEQGLFLNKSAPGQSPVVTLAFWGRDTASHVSGSISTNETASLNNLDTGFTTFGFVRSHVPSDQIVVRVNGVASPATAIVPTDDVSSSGNPYGIGGYLFDTGDYHNMFNGDLAEIIVVKGGDDVTVGLVEGYLNAKYALK